MEHQRLFHNALAVALLLVICASAPKGLAQSKLPVPGDPASAEDQAIDIPPPPNAPTKYDIPDMPKHWTSWTTYDGEKFAFRLGFVPILDYDAFSQNAASVEQVGKQDDQWDMRSFRITLSGRFKLGLPFTYLVGAEYKGLDRPPGSKGWGSTDVALTFPLAKPQYGSFTVGKTKETMSYEMVGDSANLPQLERLLTPFYTSRNVGVKYLNTLFHQNMTVSGGWYNNWWTQGQPYNTSSNQFTTRATGLLFYRNDGADYFHTAFTTRWFGATNGTLQFTARPESNVTDTYLNTGKFPGNYAMEYGAEALLNLHCVSFLGEYIQATTSAPQVENPGFYGWYITGSWVLTGEHRPYDRKVGYARRIIPIHRYGAWELVGRVGRVDLNDKSIQGGTLNVYSMNLSWWANRRWRIAAGAGRYDQYQYGITGTTYQFHARFQWVY